MKTLHVTGTANANLQNRINISIIFNYIRERGPLYRAQIAKDLKLSAPAVSRAIENLVAEGYIVETEKARTESGKKAARVVVNSDKGYVIGIDLMKEPIRIAVSDFNCRLQGEHDCFNMSDDIDLERELVAEIRRIVKRQRNSRDLKAICIGIPAVVDENGQVSSAILYASLEGRNLKRTLESAFGVPVFADNNANLSALAEAQYGAGKGNKCFMFVEFSNGIGAGVIIDGNLYRGFHGSAGEIGFSVVGRESLRHRTARKGAFEMSASIDSLREHALGSVKKSKELAARAGGRSENVTPALVCEAALAGDETCGAIVEEVAAQLAVVLINAILILDPQRVILGGAVCRLPGVERLFLDPVREMVAGSIPFSGPEIVLSTLGEEAVVVGAAHMAVESLLVGMYPYKIEA